MMMARIKFLSQVVTAALGGALAAPALAVTFTVNTVADTVDAVIGNGVCADAAGNCSLRAAVQEANAHAGLDGIALPIGNYGLTRQGGGEDQAVTGDLDVTDDLIINGTNAPATIVDAAQIDRVFHVLGGARLDMNRVTVRNGMAGNEGGGIAVATGTANLNEVLIANSRAGKGGGLAVLEGGGIVRLDKVALIDNYATVEGGGIYNLSELTMVNTTVSGNSALGHGGGILNNGMVDMTNVSIGRNTANVQNINQGMGGGLANLEHGRATITNTIVAGNHQGELAVNCFNIGTFVTNHSIESGIECGFVNNGDMRNTDPLFGTLALWGGQTPNLPLMTGSPALDAADETVCPSVDQRGAPRTSCDIGAFEAPLPTDRAITVTATPSSIKKGQEVLLNVLVTTSGPVQPNDVGFDMVLPVQLGYKSGSATPAGGCALTTTSTVHCQFGPLQPGSAGTAQIVATGIGDGGGRVTATVNEGLEPDPNTGNNTDSVDVNISSGGGGGAVDTLLLLAGLPLLALRRRRK